MSNPLISRKSYSYKHVYHCPTELQRGSTNSDIVYLLSQLTSLRQLANLSKFDPASAYIGHVVRFLADFCRVAGQVLSFWKATGQIQSFGRLVPACTLQYSCWSACTLPYGHWPACIHQHRMQRGYWCICQFPRNVNMAW